jgi:mono/diheme cytochrome c family protein
MLLHLLLHLWITAHLRPGTADLLESYGSKGLAMRTIAMLGGVVLLLVAGFFLLIYSGIYNIAATEPHTKPVRWVMTTMKQNSIRARAKDIVVPVITESAQIHRGLALYRDLCALCHGAPGISPTQIGVGILPTPPFLAAQGRDWSPAELYWVIKHGLKFAGMPSFGLKLNEPELWALVAFLTQLPTLSPKEYHQMVQAAEATQSNSP